MRNKFVLSFILAFFVAVTMRSAPAAPPTTQPSTTTASAPPSAEQLMNQMLKAPPPAPKPLQPKIDTPAFNRTTGVGGVVKTPVIALRREGTFIFDRVGRLTHNADGSQAEFTFQADAKTLADPPVIILPNTKLMAMEDIVKATNRDVLFRVTGMLTEFRGRNYLLLEKVSVPSEYYSQF
ncbi:MAG TPA: hypothetical protein VG326_06715 [Tepidisphaeraceae bacterium]|nr:hypothetical protein [Tepidisphaeraceae bacterium]